MKSSGTFPTGESPPIGKSPSTGRHQQQLLEHEGVVFNAKGYTDLRRFGWQGPDPAWAAANGFAPLTNIGADAQQLEIF